MNDINNNSEGNKRDTVTMSYNSKKKKIVDKGTGEYIDFEEIRK